MKKTNDASKDIHLVSVLKTLTKRIEEATVDIHEMKSDLKIVNLRLDSIESDLGIVKSEMVSITSDIKTIKVDMKNMRGDIDDLINLNEEMLSKMVTQEELDKISRRVTVLEN